jgi:hypothetical protein
LKFKILDNFFLKKKKENKAGLACGLACLIFFNVTGWMTHHPLFNFISKKIMCHLVA